MITIPNKEYKQRVKWIKMMYNEERRCLMCDGSFGRIIGSFGSPLSMRITDDKLRFCVKDKDDKKEIIGDCDINFCPYCGRQLRKKLDWSLCD